MHIFYSNQITDNIATLPEEESMHCAKVLRLNVGDKVNIIDGVGGFYLGELLFSHPKHCHITILESTLEHGKRPYHLHIALAPTKNIDRFEWFLEKATEMGVDEITPLLCDRSERKEIKLDRSERVVVAAAKQSIHAYMPKVNPMMPLKQFLSREFDGRKALAYCEGDTQAQLHHWVMPGESCIVMVGPEGDFSPAEVALAMGKGFTPVSLGNSRLRTETAGVMAAAALSLMNC
ncbi:16S rRNA (uracil(1498)-N(3))-methyltransferase [Williamwhitmania taraxaci]|uniref:Ribosomal RNA small subunit methyltransferase E n=1 Tax=Williamwhitmania taraxaci TaxID=1640674 RepID=A0A1G6JAV0_9BACT|nr:16S rRNA (uracil(1498)-N(3))-methyltransferase [Williamwhitmania taraxaci]SDC15789.1 16S rRNA (uracil1498-N3)-methyltransferase [Williamwhitmania taraxaci]